jgi:YD repeat-containing protein
VVATRAAGGDVTQISYAWNASFDGAAIGLWGWEETTLHVSNGRSSISKTDAFGRELAKKDMDGRHWRYVYDQAGRMTEGGRVASAASASIDANNRTQMAWYNTGLTQSITTTASAGAGASGMASTESYGYDAGGNRVRESAAYKNATASYDALNRVTNWAEAGPSTGSGSTLAAASTSTSYDAVGNIRRTQATFASIDAYGTATPGGSADYWYRYDAANRVVLDKGTFDTATNSITDGKVYGYDGAGQRSYVETQVQRSVMSNEWYWYPSHDPNDGGDPNATPQPGINGYYAQYPFMATRRETYGYNAAGQVISVIEQETGGTLITTGFPTVAVSNGIFGAATTLSTLGYDLLGRQVSQSDGVTYSRQITYNAKNQITKDENTTVRTRTGGVGQDWWQTITRNDYDGDGNFDTGSGSSYALGAIVWQHSQSFKQTSSNASGTGDGDSPDTMLKFLYAWWDGAVQSSVEYDKKFGYDANKISGLNALNLNGFNKDYTTNYILNGIGQTVKAETRDGVPKNSYYTLDANGQIINRTEKRVTVTRTGWFQSNPVEQASEAAPRELFYRYAGKQMGMVGNNGTGDVDYRTSISARRAASPEITSSNAGLFRNGTNNGWSGYADFSQSLDPLNSNQQGSAGGGTYTVRSGDTLQGIAAALWGDGNLWYRLAESNGLSAQSSLNEGQMLTLPAGVTKNSHNAGTFQPYDASEAMGDTLPTTPKPPKKPKCGVFGQILQAVVTAAITALVSMTPLAPMALPSIWSNHLRQVDGTARHSLMELKQI